MIDYQDLIDGLLVITLKVNDEEVDGIITYDENDGKYYLGTIEEPKYYEVVSVNSKNLEITAITENVEILSIEREFPQIVDTNPELPWERGTTGSLQLSNPVEQQWVLDRLKVVTKNFRTGATQVRSFVINDGMLQVRTSSIWVAQMNLFEGRKTEFEIQTNIPDKTSFYVYEIRIE